jgi:methionyl-tRNA formyltransferase
MNIDKAFLAIENGDLNSIINYFDDGLGIENQNDNGWTMLVVASFNQQLDIVEWLIDKGANVNHISKKGTTVFMYAKTKVLQTGNYDVLNRLIEAGVDLNIRDFKKNWTVLQYVEELKHEEMETYLLNYGAK